MLVKLEERSGRFAGFSWLCVLEGSRYSAMMELCLQKPYIYIRIYVLYIYIYIYIYTYIYIYIYIYINIRISVCSAKEGGQP